MKLIDRFKAAWEAFNSGQTSQELILQDQLLSCQDSLKTTQSVILDLQEQAAELKQENEYLKADNQSLGQEKVEMQGKIDLMKAMLKVEGKEVEYSETASYFFVQKTLTKAFPDADVYLSDEDYGLFTMDQLKAFLSANSTDLGTWEKEKHDCDDFAAALYGDCMKFAGNAAFGLLWIEAPIAHAINVAVLSDGKVYCIEPQNDKIYEVPKDYKGWLVVV